MRDTYRRYRAIAQCFVQLFPHCRGHQRRHLHTLAGLITGIVGAQQCQLPKIVEHAPGGAAADDSVVKRMQRWLAHADMTDDAWMLPVVRPLLAVLARRRLLLVIDGSTVGRGGMCLMVSVLYHRRALPLTWVVIAAKRGHMAEALHCALLAQLIPLVPAAAQVTLLGDGECDGTTWQAAITAQGWQYVCRTAADIRVTLAGATIAMRDLAPVRDEIVVIDQAAVTAAGYGPVQVIAVWDARYDHPLYLVTTHQDAVEAVCLYRRRAQIETYFSDVKSRGFRIDRSHLADPARLARLLIATTLAYWWVTYLGILARREPHRNRFHRTARCDLSLFSLGLRWLAYALRHGAPLPRGLPGALRHALTCSVR